MNILKNKFHLLILALFCCLNIKAQSFVKVQGGATDIAISPKDGSVYVVGTSKNVFKYDFGNERFKPFGPQTKNINKISIAKDNTVFAIQAKTYNTIKFSGSGNWKPLFSNYSSDDISTDKNGNPWASNRRASRAIKKHNGTGWVAAVSKTQLDVTKIAPVNNQLAWVILENKKIKKFENGNWRNIPGAALDIAVDFVTNDVYVIGTSKRIFKWNKGSKKWLPLAGTRTDFESLDVHNGKIWATATNKNIYYYDKNSTASSYKITFPKYTGSYNCIEFYGSMDISVSVKESKLEQNGKIYHRFIDEASNKPAKKTRIKITKLEVPLYLGDGRVVRRPQNSYSSVYNINKSFRFDIAPGVQPSDIIFIIRANIKQKCVNQDKFTGMNRRMEVKLSDIDLKQEYEIGTSGNIFGLRFKIEKL